MSIYFDRHAGQVCCDGMSIRGRMHGERTACCGLTAYNLDDEVCCAGDALHPRKFGSAIDCCVVDEAPDGHGCCVVAATGTVSSYDPSTHLCCDGALQERATTSWACCGGSSVYDVTVELCCDETVRRKAFNDATACCGTAVYNRTSAVCCDGVLQCAATDQLRSLRC